MKLNRQIDGRIRTCLHACVCLLVLSPPAPAEDPPAVSSLIASAAQAKKDKKFGEAKRFLNRAIELDRGKSAQPYIERAELEKSTKDNKHAIEDFSKAISLKPDDPALYNRRAACFEARKMWDEAANDARKAVHLESKNIDAWLLLSRIEEMRGNYKAAIDATKLPLAATSDKKQLRLKRATLFRRLNDKADCLREYDEILKSGPADAWMIFVRRARALCWFNDLKGAKQDFAKAAKLDPKNLGTTYTDLGAVEVACGEFRPAIEHLTTAISQDPRSAAAHNNRGAAYERLGDVRKAAKDFDDAIQLNPHMQVYFHNRARVAMQSGDMTTAMDNLVNSSTETKVDPHLDSKTINANFEIVLRQLDAAVKRDPEIADNFYNRAVTLFCLGRMKEAADDFQQFAERSHWRGQPAMIAAISGGIALRSAGEPEKANKLLHESALRVKSAGSTAFLLDEIEKSHTDSRLCADPHPRIRIQAHSLIGQNLVTSNNAEAGKRHLFWILENADPTSDEYSMALGTMVRLKAKLPDQNLKNMSTPPLLVQKHVFFHYP